MLQSTLHREYFPQEGALDDFSKSAASNGFYCEPKDCKAASDRAEQYFKAVEFVARYKRREKDEDEERQAYYPL
ncbi:hypothetical protein CK222_29530 [Mesorhizobium sp. WSM3866]|nr:hypothetical protein CK222_29530 [Mesorhizobium sp. WSM3866]